MAKQLSGQRRMVAVLFGGFCGTLARYLLSTFLQMSLGKSWPYDIFLINITGALLFAFVTTLAEAAMWIGPTRRMFLTVGCLGAYTTFSSLALGDVLLFGDGRWFPALLYLLGSTIGGLGAILLGEKLGQWVLKKREQPSTARTTRRLPKTPRSFAFDERGGQSDLPVKAGQVSLDRKDKQETRHHR